MIGNYLTVVRESLMRPWITDLHIIAEKQVWASGDSFRFRVVDFNNDWFTMVCYRQELEDIHPMLAKANARLDQEERDRPWLLLTADAYVELFL